ncbi:MULTISPECIES: AzlC family ABC transporter permease [unclassified Lentilitoribacter]|uniref:AzlC family ABC transporter permease n=1 Tax=unclassified Lentilitoribacter TaxID=2647570 RepID=UPI0013A6C544|nr:AzlC family ABC transporter permease [Lentilitoribacter sp. Alg239-R112]
MSNSSQFLTGLKEGFPVVVAAAPFGLLFGALASDNGLSALEAVSMSAFVFAGASQMVGIELFGQSIAPWIIVFSIFAVNFRHVLYSATLGRFLHNMTFTQKYVSLFFMTDPQFAMAEQKGQVEGAVPFWWYIGVAMPLYVFWIIEAWIGVLFGRLIENPHALGITFLLSVYFFALLMTFRKRSKFLPIVLISGLSSAATYHFIGSPWHVSVGALFGVLVAFFWPINIDQSEVE